MSIATSWDALHSFTSTNVCVRWWLRLLVGKAVGQDAEQVIRIGDDDVHRADFVPVGYGGDGLLIHHLHAVGVFPSVSR